MPLSQSVAAARSKKGLTQEELASLANVTVRTIQRIESGDTVPRAYTLKAIAAALDIRFEDLHLGGAIDPQQPAGAGPLHQKEDAINFLQLLSLSCFAYLLIPVVHFLIPIYLLKKRNEQDPMVLAYGRGMIRNQIYWVVALVLVFLLTLAYNLINAVYFNRSYLISYLIPFFVMYFGNALIIIIATIRARQFTGNQLMSG